MTALETGKRILPLSISLFLFALGGSTMTGRYSPKRIVETGLTAMVIGEILMIGLISPDLKSLGFSIALALVGGGLGLMASQLSNVNMSSVPPERGSEVGGLQGTFQNLGVLPGDGVDWFDPTGLPGDQLYNYYSDGSRSCAHGPGRGGGS